MKMTTFSHGLSDEGTAEQVLAGIPFVIMHADPRISIFGDRARPALTPGDFFVALYRHLRYYKKRSVHNE